MHRTSTPRVVGMVAALHLAAACADSGEDASSGDLEGCPAIDARVVEEDAPYPSGISPLEYERAYMRPASGSWVWASNSEVIPDALAGTETTFTLEVARAGPPTFTQNAVTEYGPYGDPLGRVCAWWGSLPVFLTLTTDDGALHLEAQASLGTSWPTEDFPHPHLWVVVEADALGTGVAVPADFADSRFSIRLQLDRVGPTGFLLLQWTDESDYGFWSVARLDGAFDP